MLVTSQLPIQTKKFCYNFLTCTCAPPLPPPVIQGIGLELEAVVLPGFYIGGKLNFKNLKFSNLLVKKRYADSR